MYRKNRISVIIVILLAFLFTIIYLTIASLKYHDSTYSNLVETGIHFHGEMMKFSSACNHTPGQDLDISISDIIQNYESFHFKRGHAFSWAFQQNSICPSGLWISERSIPRNQVHINPDMYPMNAGNTVQRAGLRNLNNSLTMSGLNLQEFTLSLFPRKRMNRNALINSCNDTTQLRKGFYSLMSFPVYRTGISLENQYEVPNEIIDPGDQPDGDAIPVPDGFCFLLFLGVIYTSWKMKIINA